MKAAPEELLVRLAELLDAAAVEYMVAGSLGSMYHGRPRTTHDVDIVIDPSQEQLNTFLDLLVPEAKQIQATPPSE